MDWEDVEKQLYTPEEIAKTDKLFTPDRIKETTWLMDLQCKVYDAPKGRKRLIDRLVEKALYRGL